MTSELKELPEYEQTFWKICKKFVSSIKNNEDILSKKEIFDDVSNYMNTIVKENEVKRDSDDLIASRKAVISYFIENFIKKFDRLCILNNDNSSIFHYQCRFVDPIYKLNDVGKKNLPEFLENMKKRFGSILSSYIQDIQTLNPYSTEDFNVIVKHGMFYKMNISIIFKKETALIESIAFISDQ